MDEYGEQLYRAWCSLCNVDPEDTQSMIDYERMRMETTGSEREYDEWVSILGSEA